MRRCILGFFLLFGLCGISGCFLGSGTPSHVTSHKFPSPVSEKCELDTPSQNSGPGEAFILKDLPKIEEVLEDFIDEETLIILEREDFDKIPDAQIVEEPIIFHLSDSNSTDIMPLSVDITCETWENHWNNSLDIPIYSCEPEISFNNTGLMNSDFVNDFDSDTSSIWLLPSDDERDFQ